MATLHKAITQKLPQIVELNKYYFYIILNFIIYRVTKKSIFFFLFILREVLKKITRILKLKFRRLGGSSIKFFTLCGFA